MLNVSNGYILDNDSNDSTCFDVYCACVACSVCLVLKLLTYRCKLTVITEMCPSKTSVGPRL